MQMNQCRLAGYLGSKPELQYTHDDTPIVIVRLGETDDHFKEEKGRGETTEWHTLVFCNDAAMYVAEHYVKGDNLYVEGCYRSRKVVVTQDKREQTFWEFMVHRFAKVQHGPMSEHESPPNLDDPEAIAQSSPGTHEVLNAALQTQSNAAWPI
jgi:single-stranded DNA-binding protein